MTGSPGLWHFKAKELLIMPFTSCIKLIFDMLLQDVNV